MVDYEQFMEQAEGNEEKAKQLSRQRAVELHAQLVEILTDATSEGRAYWRIGIKDQSTYQTFNELLVANGIRPISLKGLDYSSHGFNYPTVEEQLRKQWRWLKPVYR